MNDQALAHVRLLIQDPFDEWADLKPDEREALAMLGRGGEQADRVAAPAGRHGWLDRAGVPDAGRGGGIIGGRRPSVGSDGTCGLWHGRDSWSKMEPKGEPP